MEGADAVDVSWLHHSQRDNLVRSKSAPPKPSPKPGATPSNPNPGTNDENAVLQKTSSDTTNIIDSSQTQQIDPDDATPESTPSQPSSSSRSAARPIPSRRNSWISTLSSKFSSGSTPPSQSHMRDLIGNARQQPQAGRTDSPNPFGASFSPKDVEKKDDHPTAFNGSPKGGHPSFFQNALRKLSSGNSGMGKAATSGGRCPRRVMNIDADRDRCKIPELDPAKLRRVAFCVDVEIAGTARRSDSEDDKPPKANGSNKKAEPKTPEKKDEGSPPPDQTTPETVTGNNAGDNEAEIVDPTKDDSKQPGKEMTKKQEKKKKSEEERKERKEKKRRQAEENGSVPIQFNLDDPSSAKKSSPSRRSQKGQDQPTTDPVRIYRRCCQLRETGVLKKMVEQISSPSSALAESPGTVAVLDLTGFWMTQQDVATFSDWLAIVPVRKLILQNCGLTDESVRVILGGLLATKTIEASRNARRSKKANGGSIRKEDRYGAIEKLSLKDNPKIGVDGWRHISLFVHMSRSLKGIDLSGIPFQPSETPTGGPTSTPSKQPNQATAVSALFATALEQRFGGCRLEELVLSECSPTTEDIQRISSAARAMSLRRLGLANNNLTKDGFEHVIHYLKGGKCEGLDLGGNDLNEHMGLLSSALEKTMPLMALSLADCSISSKSVCPLLQGLVCLQNFRFIDLSHNHDLFSPKSDSLGGLRRYLPQMKELRRIHLADVCLKSEHAIALAEIIPDCPKLCHLNILENPAIEALAAASDASGQEEACALYASLMSAARISRTLIAIDIDVPSAENNEVVKALASQIVAYSLRNLERGELGELSSSPEPGTLEKDIVPVPEILAHLVGNTDDIDDDIDEAKLAADEDYVIGGTGVVKALGICLGTTDYQNIESALDRSPTASGTSTPLRRLSLAPSKKPRDMSRDLLNSARRIRARLQLALVREDKAGNDLNYRRLQFLDFTLHRMIQRFEDEFPETRLQPSFPAARSISEASSSEPPNESIPESSAAPPPLETSPVRDTDIAIDDDYGDVDIDRDQFAVRLSRTSSNTSLHSRALTSEEGRVHRLGQHLTRDFLDSELDNHDAPVSQSPSDNAQVSLLRDKLDHLRRSEGQLDLESVEELGSSLEDLLALQEQDPEAFAKFKESQLVALINAGLRGQESG